MWNPFKKTHTRVEMLEVRLKEAKILKDDEVLGVTENDNGIYTVGIFKPIKE